MSNYLLIFFVFLLIIGICLAFYFLVVALRVGKKRLMRKLRKAEKLIKANKYDKALIILDNVLQDNGYNYRLPRQKKSIFHLEVYYPDLEPAILTLTEVLRTLGKGTNNLKVYEDMLSMIAELDEVKFGKGNIAGYKKNVYERMSQYYLDDKDYKSCLMYNIITKVEELKSLKLLGKTEELKDKLPIKEDPVIVECLEKLGLPEILKDFLDMINGSLRQKIEETTPHEIMSIINDFIKNVRETMKRRKAVEEVKAKKEEAFKETKEESKDKNIIRL